MRGEEWGRNGGFRHSHESPGGGATWATKILGKKK